MEIELKKTFESGDIEDVDGLFTAYDIIADGVKVGACSLIQWDDDSALIERIDIDEAFRGKRFTSLPPCLIAPTSCRTTRTHKGSTIASDLRSMPRVTGLAKMSVLESTKSLPFDD